MLDRLKEKKNNDRLTLTLTYHLSLKNFQNVLHEAHNFLIPNKEHRNVFRDNLPMIGWRKPKSLKDPLVSAKIKCGSSSDKSAPCRSRRQFVLLFRKPILFKIKIKVKRLTSEKGFWTEVAIWLFTWFSVNHVLSSMWAVLWQRSVPVLITVIKVGLK